MTQALSRYRLAGLMLIAAGLTAGCDSSVQGLLALGSTKPACAAPENSAQLVAEVLTLVNQERVLRGLNPLTMNKRLAAAAMSYACTMVEDEFFGHDHPQTGEGFADRHAASEFRCHPAGENLARGHVSAPMVVEDWLNSPTHRDNILTDGYLEMGLGLRQDSLDGRLYWVQLLIGERIESCANDFDAIDVDPITAPAPGAPHEVTGRLNSMPTIPSGHNDELLTDSPTIKPESADPTADE